MNTEQIRLIPGDIFDAEADLFIIPCSTAGTISRPFRLGLERALGYRFKDDLGENAPGSVLARVFQKGPGKKVVIIFAVAVDGASSSITIIENLASGIIRTIASYKNIDSVAMPLIGAGAGNLDEVLLYNAWMTMFINCDLNVELSLYVLERAIYERITKAFGITTDENFADSMLYLVDPVSEESQEMFYLKGLWLNTHTNAVPLVKQMQEGSFLIVKRYLKIEESNGIVVFAMGKITQNYGNGEQIGVDWVLKNVEIPVKTPHRYDRAVARVGSTNGVSILEKIEMWVKSVYPRTSGQPETTIRAVSKIASLRSDSDKGEDHLDIKRDYVSFAKIIAAKDFIPPLSVALLGKWGSGKSFFMNKLSSQISKYEGTTDYCSGIVQIHFNAWSYMDANLWASMVSRIFEGLYGYIGGLDAAESKKKEITDNLNQQLTIASDELSKISAEKEKLTTQITDLENRKTNLKASLKSRIDELKSNTFKKAVEKLNSTFKVTEQLTKVVKEDGDIKDGMKKIEGLIPKEYFKNPDEAYQKAKSGYTFLKAFFAPKEVVRNIIFLALILLAIWLMPILVVKLTGYVNLFIVPYIQSSLFLLSLAAPTIIRLKKTYKEIAPIVSAIWKIRNDYHKELEIIRSEVEQEQRVAELQIAAYQAEINAIDTELLKTKETLAELSFRKDHAIATEALYSFIEKRCNSGEYQKHLGIVSIIRKDFEILSNLFVDHQKEFNSFDEKVDEKVIAFRKLFGKPLERIVLYIDDLDRCPEDRVVEVLEAVNLLMAFPLFVVVVGIDPRWVKKALTIRYQKLFNEDADRERMSASDYLEKIFQVPFHLKEAEDRDIKNMLAQLIDVADDSDEAEKYAPSVNVIDSGVGFIDVKTKTESKAERPGSKNTSSTDKAQGGSELSADDPYLKLSVLERNLIQDMSGILGPNPRAIKRFVNIYKIVRAHEGLSYFQSEEKNSFLKIMFLLAVYNGQFRNIAFELDKLIRLNNEDNDIIASFLITSTGNWNLDQNKSALYAILMEMPNGKYFLEKNFHEFRELNKLIRRFCFSI